MSGWVFDPLHSVGKGRNCNWQSLFRSQVQPDKMTYWVFYFTLWAIGGVLLVFITTSLLIAKLHRGKAANSFTLNAEAYYRTIAGYIVKCLPVHPSTGWGLKGVVSGLRVFTRPSHGLPPLHPMQSQQELMAASLILDLSIKRALALTWSVKELGSWWTGMPASGAQLLPGPWSSSKHVVQFPIQRTTTSQGLVQQLGSVCHVLAGSLIRKSLGSVSILGDVSSHSSSITTEHVERPIILEDTSDRPRPPREGSTPETTEI